MDQNADELMIKVGVLCGVFFHGKKPPQSAPTLADDNMQIPNNRMCTCELCYGHERCILYCM
jgi:hypothetical protein